MSTYLIGVEPKKGEFTGENGTICYNNRVLYCVTEAQGVGNIGYFSYQIKLKASDLASSLGVPERDDAVDLALAGLIRKEIDIVNAPRNGVLTVVGIRPIKIN